MDEAEVKRVLAPYCPPLGQSQIELIASKIVELSKSELEASKVVESVGKVAARRRKRSGKSRSRV